MSNTTKVIFRTVARNCERTIARAIESVLAQTYDNWELHLVDNASTDKTVKIMESYSTKDPRIAVYINEGNFVWKEGNKFTDYYRKYDLQNTFMCSLDGDDEYKPEFLEKMIAFAQKHKLDIVCCGFDYVDDGSKKLLAKMIEDEEIVIAGDNFDKLLPVYYPYMRTRWAKLFRLTVTDKLDLDKVFYMYYGDDTIESIEYFRNAESAGIYPETFYIWYKSPGSVSYRWDSRRIECDRIIYDTIKEFLISKTGGVSPGNDDYILWNYLACITSTCKLLLSSDIRTTDKLDGLSDIFSYHLTKRLANTVIKYQVQKEEFFQSVTDWIFAQAGLCNEAYFDKIVDIIGTTMTMPQSYQAWDEASIVKTFTLFAARYGNNPK